MASPTKIIKAPEVRKILSGGKKVSAKIFTCNDGKEYTLAQLSEATAIPLQMLTYRIRRYPWQSEMILNPENLKTRAEMTAINEWEGLSEKVRRKNLVKLKSPGSWERAQNKPQHKH
jgi:hypothetical protein